LHFDANPDADPAFLKRFQIQLVTLMRMRIHPGSQNEMLKTKENFICFSDTCPAIYIKFLLANAADTKENKYLSFFSEN
jgi:hypothetical protein